jgi:hypothetical protein
VASALLARGFQYNAQELGTVIQTVLIILNDNLSSIGDWFDLPGGKSPRPQQVSDTHHQPLKFITATTERVVRRVGYTMLKIQINWF